MFLVGYKGDEKHEYEKGASPCLMCRKMIINAGIEKVVVRQKNKNEYIIIDVQDWIDNDDLLEGKITY